jgi:hypothetical protein
VLILTGFLPGPERFFPRVYTLFQEDTARTAIRFRRFDNTLTFNHPPAISEKDQRRMIGSVTSLFQISSCSEVVICLSPNPHRSATGSLFLDLHWLYQRFVKVGAKGWQSSQTMVFSSTLGLS